jgi:membrane fusion protein (multidrug efflux system)
VVLEPPTGKAEILARVSGVIHELRAEEGDYVRQGEALLLIENDEYRLRLEQAEATRADVEARHRRAKEMLERGLVSPEEFDALASQLQSAKAQEELARLSLSYTEVVAPFSGRVVERLVDMGQNVSEGTPLFRLADFDPLLARVHVPSKEFKRLKPDQPVEVVLESTQERMPGHIKLVSPVIDRESGTIKVTIEIPQYPATTRPGDFAQVRVVTEQRPNCLLAPKIALVSDRGEQVVFVVADSAAERRVVEVGFEDDQSAEILDGLSDGERVVVKGQRSLKHGSPVKVMTDDIFTAQAPAAAEKAP